ncbi:LAMI_0E09956g1_1 [Lachancea mirantina]|uniref:LAMI_0E09956g1_1 n=1 Tax=Lachancea mirantina TaxID=1230905 RepID=A0A1G4JP70_9SACH|nr:LAMI_0E09956g1_1 [Lachancea mirantina]
MLPTESLGETRNEGNNYCCLATALFDYDCVACLLDRFAALIPRCGRRGAIMSIIDKTRDFSETRAFLLQERSFFSKKKSPPLSMQRDNPIQNTKAAARIDPSPVTASVFPAGALLLLNSFSENFRAVQNDINFHPRRVSTKWILAICAQLHEG